MEPLNFDSQWFLSEPGCKAFSCLQTLEERSIFLYSCLKSIAHGNFDKDQLLFKTAFFLADAVFGSSLPYASYPDIADPGKNPYVAYWANTSSAPDRQTLYYIFLSILHGIADPMQSKDWIYDKGIRNPEEMEAKLKALDHNFCENSVTMADPRVFETDASLQLIQLKLIWLLGQQ